MDNRQEIIDLHYFKLPENHVPMLDASRRSVRDAFHYEWAINKLTDSESKTVLDIGCFDGWLDFMFIDTGFQVTGIEIIAPLAEAARRYAQRNFIKYKVYNCFFDQFETNEKFDAVVCFETLEHVVLTEVPSYVEKMEQLAKKQILISLPDQDAKDNKQHVWTPTENLIEEMFGPKKDFCIERREYPGTGIPANWMISYNI